MKSVSGKTKKAEVVVNSEKTHIQEIWTINGWQGWRLCDYAEKGMMVIGACNIGSIQVPILIVGSEITLRNADLWLENIEKMKFKMLHSQLKTFACCLCIIANQTDGISQSVVQKSYICEIWGKCL